jgi:hypothetical protein
MDSAICMRLYGLLDGNNEAEPWAEPYGRLFFQTSSGRFASLPFL